MSRPPELAVPLLTGEKLIRQGYIQRSIHTFLMMGTLSLTNQRIILRDGFIWYVARRAHVFDLSEVTVGDGDVPWHIRPYGWLGGVWWLESEGKRFYFLNAWFSRWIQDIRKAQSKVAQ